MNTIKRAAALLVAGSAILVAGNSFAADDTANLTVTATVAAQCSVGDATLALGAITLVNTDGTMKATPGGGSTISIPWACTNGTQASLAFDLGGNSTGTNRRMLSSTAGSFIEYALSTGTTSGGTAIAATPVDLGLGDGANKTFAIWGGPTALAANTTAKAATDYTDTVVLTIAITP